MLRTAAVFVAAMLTAPTLVLAQALDATLPGKAIFDATCATCHAAPAEVRVPTMAALAAMPAAQLRDAMNDGGKMAEIAAGLATAQRAQVVAYLTSAQTAAAAKWADTLTCAADKRS
ncbi:MAG TPA: c-type cytochrome, partial [Vicinamibacterales bacterium]|nr:c-type cytochrome [Vicinamibacterales bacterium]